MPQRPFNPENPRLYRFIYGDGKGHKATTGGVSRNLGTAATAAVTAPAAACAAVVDMVAGKPRKDKRKKSFKAKIRAPRSEVYFSADLLQRDRNMGRDDLESEEGHHGQQFDGRMSSAKSTNSASTRSATYETADRQPEFNSRTSLPNGKRHRSSRRR
ncbi:hypothetical protein P389DRAFT_197059 [Cystobasidium minutum MCA 4210]|uniref:uncharacterized protein n=1 Tax=Cystobasidium minutum MCA 4210 TaxID=1397322 RepID=UPI0034D01DAD|eukprot:jgi/Rhomi1/197059/gm1.5273_g